MYVVATAGHVDHGKSTLVRALTGMEPDRWAEERRRGMTIDLGYAWMTLSAGERLAFVDVPGHERFVPNMLAGLGPVPAVLFIVAADGGWMPQSAEHLAAVNALGVRHGLLVVTRCDLADPGPASRQAQAEIARTSLGAVGSYPTGPGSKTGQDHRAPGAFRAYRPVRPRGRSRAAEGQLADAQGAADLHHRRGRVRRDHDDDRGGLTTPSRGSSHRVRLETTISRHSG